jgi:phosphatidylinositol alpha-1,6-mannosyltransferase
MRIGLVAPEFPPDIGGVQTYAWNMANELARLGHEVTVFAQSHTAVEGSAADFRTEPVLSLRRQQDRAILHRYHVDVWHCMNAPHAWLALETEPVFVTVHGNDFLSPYHPIARLDLRISDRLDRWFGDVLTKRLVRRALPRAQHVFANSRYTEDVFLQHYPACRGKTSVASVGIADVAFAQHETPRACGPARLITICRLAEPRKNLAVTLEALSRLRCCGYDFHYTIVGDGELRSKLEGIAATLGLAELVTFAGFVGPEKKIDLLRRSDLFVLPAVATAKSFEGFGLVYLEANACGTPVLAARVAGAVEAVEEGISGYFVEAPTVEGIASALSRFLRGEVTFRTDACEAFARRFSWEAVIKHCVAHYDEALRT